MDWYEAEVRQLQESVSRRERPVNPVVFYGSSTIRLWEHLAEDLGDERALNLGFGGSTLEACVYFFDRLIPPVQPCSLVVYAGDNDLGDGRDPEHVLDSFRSLAAKVESELGDVEFAFISIKPSPSRVGIIQRIREANRMVRDEIKSTGHGYFIDLFGQMLDSGGNPRSELFEADGLHLSLAGYRLWTDLLFPYRNRIFTEDCSSGNVNALG